MDKIKHPYFRREPKGGLVLQDRDFQILEFVHQFRFLDSQTLGRLVGHQGSDWALGSRLKRLFEHRFLDRPRKQLVLKVTGEERHLIYGLGPRGAELLGRQLGLPLEDSRWSQRNQEAGEIFIHHVLGLSRFRACLYLALGQPSSDKAFDYSRPHLLTWKQGENLRARVEIDGPQGKKERIAFLPDGYLGLAKAHPPPNRSYFFVEFERGTVPLKRFLRSKGLAYRAYWKAGLHKKHLGIQGFRVLIISPTERKSRTLREYIGHWLVAVGLPHSKTWLFTSETRYDVRAPETILAPIWETADGEQVSILD